jgi:DNA-binding beta-propeller fold protein YncE
VAVDCGPCEGFVFERQWGVFGSGNSQFVDPKGIAVDGLGNVYVADTDNDRIQKFDNDGTFLLKWGGNGTMDGKFRGPGSVAVDANGDVHVADTANGRIQKFTSSGAFIAWLDDDPNTFKTYDGLAIDSGTVYATYYIAGGDRIEKLSATTGALLGSIGSSGTNEGERGAPKGIALDAAGNLYVGDWGNHRVQIFDPSGAVSDVIGGFETGPGEFNLPVGVAIDGDGTLFVLDQKNERVQKFRPAGAAGRRIASASKHAAGARLPQRRRERRRRARR